MNVPHRLLTVALVALSLSACRDRSEAPSKADAATGAPAAAKGAAPIAPGALNRAMRISVNLALVAKDVDASAEQVRTAVNEAGGYVSQSQLAGEQDSRSATLQAKVPADQLAAFRQSLRGFGTVAQESEKAEDVTEQQADIKAQEKRLLELLSDRTGNLADVLTAEKSLAEIRETIERLEAQETTLDKQIAFATLDIRISSDRNELALSPGERISSAFGKGFTVAGEMLVVFGVILVGAAPSLVMLGALAYAGYRLIRLFRGRKAAPVRG